MSSSSSSSRSFSSDSGNVGGLHKEKIVKPDEFLRAAALNDLYTLRKFFDYECRYAWDQLPRGTTNNEQESHAREHRHEVRLDDSHFDKAASEHKSQGGRYRTQKGESAAMLAASYGNFRALRLLMKNCTYDIHEHDQDGFSIVHHAVLGGNLDCVRFVLKKGGKFNDHAKSTARGRGETPFMLGVRCHRKKIVKYFMKKHNVDYHDKNALGQNVHAIAQVNGRGGMIWLMRKKTGEQKSEAESNYVQLKKTQKKDSSSSSDKKKLTSSSSSSVKGSGSAHVPPLRTHSRSSDHHPPHHSKSSSSNHHSTF